MKFKIKKNDLVEVITGKSRGKRGKVLKVDSEKGRVVVEGVNIMKKHERPTQKNQQGGITEREFPVNISNVMLVDPKKGVRTRVGRNVNVSKDGGRTIERFAKKSGEALA
jgi:large subunit ribosomal protein L24